jgi:pimeloyl-ACP methyl ester carboxylesterase
MPVPVLRLAALLGALWLAAPAAAQDQPATPASPPGAMAQSPGTLLQTERLAALPAGMQGWRIRYATAIDEATPASGVATVLAPDPLPAGALPAITWAHGTTGLLQRCMPSHFPDPTAGIPALAQIMARGWVVVAPDYPFAEEGGPHPFLLGDATARAILDALRAARALPGLPLSGDAVVWGHAQGGHAALWTGIIAPAAASDLVIRGIAAIAPIADPAAVLSASPGVDLLLGPYLATAFARFHPDLAFTDLVRPGARVAARDIAALCAAYPPSDTARLFARAATIPDGVLALGHPGLAARLAANAASAPIGAPLLVAQGEADIIVPAALTEAWAAARCAAGQTMELLRFAGQDHAGLLRPGSPLEAPLLDWTAARLAGSAPPPGCPVTRR